jgi:thiol-disulfide isomerase/thioredoxin
MNRLKRRAALAAALAAMGTLAVAIATRKSANRDGSPVVADDVPAEPPLKPIAAALVRVEPPKALPALHFAAADGTTQTLADFAGKGVVLNLWATWCGPCAAELPSLDRLAATLAPDDIVVVPLSSDRGGAAVVEQYYKNHGIAHLGVWIDPDETALQALGARGIPTTLILDREGRERARLEGGIDWASKDAAALVRKLAG